MEIVLRSELRPCVAKGEKLLFHTWEQYSRIYNPLLRGEVGGQLSQMYGLCEDENGQMIRVEPHEIKFIGNPFQEYCFEAEN